MNDDILSQIAVLAERKDRRAARKALIYRFGSTATVIVLALAWRLF